MDFLVQKAIDLGFDPIMAVQMATINVARHFRLDHLVGGIAPGRYADIVIVPDRRTIRAEYVISNGRLVARDGQLLVAPRKHAYPKSIKGGIPLPRDFTAGDFAIPVNSNRQRAKVRIMDLVTSLVAREAVVDMPVSNGELSIDVAADLLKIAAIDWVHRPGKTFVGFIRGLKMKRGAMATSYTWDLTDLISVGASESDMAQAVNRLRELKGGIVACVDGKIAAELPLPVAGLISEKPMETIALELDSLQRVAAGLGFPYPDIRITLAVMTTPAIAFLRICEDGLFNIAQNSFVDLVVD